GDPSGNIFIGGNINNRFVVAKLKPDGQLDTSFGADGDAIVVFTRHGRAQQAGVSKIIIDSKGNIIAAGGGERWLELVRFTPNGIPDPSFGNGGTFRLTMDQSDIRFGAVAVGKDDSIFAASSSGNFINTTGVSMIVVHVLKNG